MSIRNRTRAAEWGSISLFAVALFSSSQALAVCPLDNNQTPTCASIAAANPTKTFIYGIGGSAQTPLMRQVGYALLETDYRLIYADSGACFGVTAILDSITAGTTNVGTQAFGNPTATTPKFWQDNGLGGVEQCGCTIPNGQVQFDFGLMGNSGPLCGYDNPDTSGTIDTQTGHILPSYIDDSLGPVSSVSVIVAQGSPETSISSSAIAAIYRNQDDASKRPAPWTIDASIYGRSATSYVEIFLAIASGSTPAQIASSGARDLRGNEAMAEKVGEAVGTPAARAARIGFVSSEIADQYATTVSPLAYQHDLGGQTCGYWPDSTINSRDKINVRTGQYYLWSATHFFTRNDAANVKPAARALITWLRRAQGGAPNPTWWSEANPEPAAPAAFLEPIVRSGNIPECAMQVTRGTHTLASINNANVTDLGPLASFAPLDSCGCYFELLVDGSAPESCVPCTEGDPSNNPYTNGECHHGFWEPS